MKSHLYLVYVTLAIITKPWTATALPTTNVDINSNSSPGNGETIERRQQRPNTSWCSTVCGSSRVADCTALLLNKLHSPPQAICATVDNDVAGNFGKCGFAYINPFDTDMKCLSGSELQEFGKQLVQDCAKDQGFGGCFMLSDGTFLCNFDPESSCHQLI